MEQGLLLINLMVMYFATDAQNQMNMEINEEAPVVQSQEIIIKAEAEKIWQTLTEIEKWSDWNQRIKDPYISLKPDVGASFSWKINGSKINSQIHSYIPNKALGWKGKTFGATAIHNWYLEPLENGTKVFVEESMEGWIIWLFKNKMNSVLKEDLTYWLQQLKEECEE